MQDMKVKAQEFMVQQMLKECFECDGWLFKHRANANARSKSSGKEVIVHTINAAAKKEKPE